MDKGTKNEKLKEFFLAEDLMIRLLEIGCLPSKITITPTPFDTYRLKEKKRIEKLLGGKA